MMIISVTLSRFFSINAISAELTTNYKRILLIVKLVDVIHVLCFSDSRFIKTTTRFMRSVTLSFFFGLSEVYTFSWGIYDCRRHECGILSVLFCFQENETADGERTEFSNISKQLRFIYVMFTFG